MAEMANIDPNFEPQSRPRSGTWPLNRPNIPPRRNRMLDMGGGTLLGATLEEANSQELIAGEPSMLLETPPMMKDDYLPMLSPDSMLNPTDFDSVLIGLPSAPTANFVEDFPLSASLVKPEPGNINNILGNYCTTTTITELSNLSETQNFDEVQNLQCQSVSSSANFSPGGNITPLSISPTTNSTTVSSTQSTPSTSTGTTPKTKSTRKNAWGNMSYADLITQGIESAPDKRLTLAQVYEWMVKNVPYFKDKGDSNSSAGWKNSIRHNLSLHAKFKRIQNEGTGKSSWWVINHEAKPGKPTRRRAISMDNGNQKYNRSRNKVIAKHKAELIKKQKPGLKTGETATWGCAGTSGLETTVSKALGSEYRQRTCSNASTGRLSPTHLFPPQDLEDNGAPSLSPLGSATNLSNLGTSLPSAFSDIFNLVRPENASSTIPESNEPLHNSLLTSLANMDVVSPPVPYGDQQQVDSKSAIYLQQMTDNQQTPKRKNLGNNVAKNSPNLASLLQGAGKSTPKKSQTLITKREPEWTESTIPFGYSDYQNTQMMNQVLQSPSQYKPQLSEAKPMYHYVVPCSNIPEGVPYTQQGRLQQQPQVNYIQQQQQAEMQQYLANQQRQQQMVPMENQQPPPPLYPGEGSNLVQMSGKFPSDINLEPYDSGDLDMAEVLKDMPPSNDSYTFEVMDFDGKPVSYYQQTRMQESNDYNMGLNGNDGLLQQRQAPPVRHPNPDVFIANTGPGTTSMDLMEGCRMNNAANFQCMQPGQTPSVGAASSYTMQ